jgi:hypothetical protein
VERADLVVLHRVVCCYPDYAAAGAAADHARRALVFGIHPEPALQRLLWGVQPGDAADPERFRGFAHPPGAMLEVLEAHGLRRAFQHRSLVWQVAGLERVS